MSHQLKIMFSRSRCYSAFRLQSAFNNESRFSLSKLDSLLSYEPVAKPTISGDNSLSVKEQALLFPITNNSQSRMSRLRKMRILTRSFFVISSYNSEDVSYAFSFIQDIDLSDIMFRSS